MYLLCFFLLLWLSLDVVLNPFQSLYCCLLGVVLLLLVLLLLSVLPVLTDDVCTGCTGHSYQQSEHHTLSGIARRCELR